EELYLELFGIIADRRHGDVFRFVQRLLDEGYDLAEFYRGLADALRTLMVVKFDGPDAIEVREDLRDAYAAAAALFSTGDLVRMLAQVAELDTDGRFRKSANPRILLEAVLLRFAHLDRTVELEDLVRAATGGAPAMAGREGDGVGGGSTRVDATTAHGTSAPHATGAATGRAAWEQAKAALAQALGKKTTPPPAPSAAATPAAQSAAPSAAPAPIHPAPAHGPADPTRPPAAAPAASAQSAEPAADSAAAPAAPSAAAVALDPAALTATAALDAMLADNDGIPRGLGLFLKAATIAEETPDRVVLELPPGPGLERLTTEHAARQQLESALARRLGRTVALEVRAQGRAGERAAAPPRRLTPEQVKADRLRRLLQEEPLLGRAVQEWDLELEE